MAQLTYPGVYIEEFAPGAPIQGVGTSTAAILAPTSDGPLGEPTKITSFDAYQAQFGDPPAGFYGWYAARGFFDNGGRGCFVVRGVDAPPPFVGVLQSAARGRQPAARAAVELLDSSAGAGKPTLVVRARDVGVPAPDIEVDVDDDAAISNVAL